MSCHIGRLACLWVIPLLSAATLATAAEPDLRLVNAVAAQDRTAVRALLKQRIDVNVARADGTTALLYAAHWDDIETIDLLLRAGANPNTADDHGVTPLARACENASIGVVEKLLKAGVDPNAAQTSGLTPLMIAARTGNLQVVTALLAHGANVNAVTTETRNSALMWAVAGRHSDIVRALIGAQADVHLSMEKGFTPLLIAARNGDIDIARALIAAGVSVNDTGTDGIHALPFSIVVGQADFALFLLDQGADPNGAMAGIRALHAAVTSVRPWLTEWSQKHGAAGRVKDLTRPQRRALVTALLARGADLNSRITNSAVFEPWLAYPRKGAFEAYSCGTGDLRGATPLWLVAHAANGRAGIVYNGVDAPDPDGGASEANRTDTNIEIIRMLLAAGANHRLTTDDGTTVLMVAAGLGRCTNERTLNRGRRSPAAEEAVRLLLDAGADVKAVNEADFTALHGAAFRGLNEVIQILVDHGANINARDFRGRTPYRLAQGNKQAFYFQEYPETAEFIEKSGGNTSLGLPGIVQERLRDVSTTSAAKQRE
jgi:ankyrin repeat protein